MVYDISWSNPCLLLHGMEDFTAICMSNRERGYKLQLTLHQFFYTRSRVSFIWSLLYSSWISHWSWWTAWCSWRHLWIARQSAGRYEAVRTVEINVAVFWDWTACPTHLCSLVKLWILQDIFRLLLELLLSFYLWSGATCVAFSHGGHRVRKVVWFWALSRNKNKFIFMHVCDHIYKSVLIVQVCIAVMCVNVQVHSRITNGDLNLYVQSKLHVQITVRVTTKWCRMCIYKRKFFVQLSPCTPSGVFVIAL